MPDASDNPRSADALRAAMNWREVNDVTDDEWGRLAGLLCDHEPRDLALQILRLQAKVRCLVERLDQAGALSKAEWDESHLAQVELDNDE